MTNRGLVEGLLFASTHAVSKKTMVEVLNLSVEELDSVLEEIRVDFDREDHGFHLVSIAGGYQFRTKAELKDIMAKFYEKKPPRLTQQTLEVLSVIAYKQPVTRPEIEKIRGVDCSGILQALLERELIEMQGRSDLPGHPVIYGTTPKFLEWFQINNLGDLPPLSEMEALNRGRAEETDNLLQFMNRDDGFQAESLADMDETLKGVRSTEVGFPEEAKPEGAAPAVDTPPAASETVEAQP